MEKTIDQLRIQTAAEPLPSVEVDADSTENGEHREILEACLKRFAEKHPDRTISIYDYVTTSFNFGEPTQSVFFVAADSLPLMEEFYSDLQAAKGLRYRYSDYISPREANLAYHVENGQAWRREDMISFALIE